MQEARHKKYKRSKVDTSSYPSRNDDVLGLIVAKTPANQVAEKIKEGHTRQTCLLLVEVTDLKQLPEYLIQIERAQFLYVTLGFVHVRTGSLFLLARTPCFKAKSMVKNRGVAQIIPRHLRWPQVMEGRTEAYEDVAMELEELLGFEGAVIKIVT